jgi:type III secretory pathway lipoprotein EscJ
VRRALLVLVLVLGACNAHVDSPADEHAAGDRARGAALAAQLQTLPGVARASAIVETPFADPLAPDTHAPPSASIAIAAATGADPAAIERDARRLAAAAIHADPAAIAVAIEAPPAAPELARVGPFEVSARSKTALTITLVGALALIAGLAAWIAWTHRLRGTRPQ